MFLKIRGLLLATLVASALPALAQPKKNHPVQFSPEALERLKMGEDTLALLSYAVVNDSIEQERFAACRALITTLVRTLKVENSFHYIFDRVKSVSIMSPPDSSFRIFTWQLFVNDSTYRYYGAIQMNTPELKLTPLVDRSDNMEIVPMHESLPPDNWYGVLYYNLIQFDSKEGRKYLLFGYDAYSFFDKRKVIDVLSFDKNGVPAFGAPVFDKPGAKKAAFRMLFEYSAEASARVNWDEQYQMVLFDHLIPVPSPFGRGITFVTDGSYDGLQLDKGRWKFVDKVFNDVMSEPPRPEPVLDNRSGKDILGRSKTKKTKGGP